MSFVSQVTGALVGAAYLKEEKANFLTYLTGLAVDRIEERKAKKIQRGEGLLGQVLVDRSPSFISPVPDNYLDLTSSLGSGKLAELLILPLMADNQVVGALEMVWAEKIQNCLTTVVLSPGESFS